MTTFTASEVRDRAQWLKSNGFITEPFMLYAYADRLEADEKAGPEDKKMGVCAIGADVTTDVTGSVSLLAASDQAVQTRATPSIFDMAEQCGAEMDGGEYPDAQTGFPGASPSITFTDRQLEKFVVMFCTNALAAHSAPAQPPAASVTDEMVERARSAFVRADDGSTGITDAIRAALLAAQENPNA